MTQVPLVQLISATRFLADAHVSADPAALGKLDGQIKAFLQLGLDGFFTDHPHLDRLARDAFIAR